MDMLTDEQTDLLHCSSTYIYIYIYIYTSVYLSPLQAPLKSSDYGKHLEDVESLLEKHLLVETEITSQLQRLKQIDEQYNILAQTNHPQRNVLQEHYFILKKLYQVSQNHLQRNMKRIFSKCICIL